MPASHAHGPRVSRTYRSPLWFTRILARIPSSTFLGRVARLPLRFIPQRPVETIRSGPLRGHHWVVASGVHGYWLGTYEGEMQYAVAHTVAPGGVFFDVGAHAGYYSLLAAALVTAAGRVAAFEPDARNIGHLKEHLRLNDAGNVAVIEAAVADRSGHARFAPEASGFGGALSETGAIDVATVSLDDLVDAGRLPAPHYLKIDVEGAEFRVLRGARKILEAVRPTIFLAVHDSEAAALCQGALTALGYAIRPIARDALVCMPW